MSGSDIERRRSSRDDGFSIVGREVRSTALRGFCALAVCAAMASPVVPQPGGTTGAAASYDWVPVVDPAATGVPDPPDGRWLRDENGLEYTLFAWRKHEGYYHFEADHPGFVKLNHVLRLAVEHQDDEFLYLRWYRTAPIVESLAEDQQRAAEEAAAIRASYNFEIPSSDGIRLVAWDQGLPKAQQWRNGFAIADMNGDGQLDLVHGPPRKGSVGTPVIFLGDGAGSWRYWEAAKFPPLAYDYGDVAVGDLDGDGHQDIVLASHLTGFFALRGDGSGGFSAWSEGLPLRRSAVKRQREIERELQRRSAPKGAASPPTSEGRQRRRRGADAQGEGGTPETEAAPVEPPAITSRAIALADWNGDGRLDILALSEGPSAIQDITDEVAPPLGKVIFLNQGNGTWQPLYGPGQLMGDVLLPVDLDRDGHLDFVTDSRMVSGPQIFNYGGAADGSWTVGEIPEMRAKLIVHGVAVDDFDRDGRLDVALTFQSQEGGEVRDGLDLYRGTAEKPGWRRTSIFAATVRETEGMETLVAGDVDSDGDPDLVALTVEGNVWLFLNDGKGGFVRELSPEADPAKEHLYCSGYDAAVLDLDGDGKNELVTSFAGEPGSEAMFIGAIAKRCDALGAIRAWKIVSSTGGTGEAAPGGSR